MSDKKEGGGIGVCGVLTIIFIVLKCLRIINWSWLLVFSPIWIPVAVIILIILIYKMLGE